MRAFLGLLSEPARVQDVTADGITLHSPRKDVPGRTVLVELTNDAGSFALIVPVQLVQVVPHPEGGCVLEGRFVKKLSDADVRALLA